MKHNIYFIEGFQQQVKKQKNKTKSPASLYKNKRLSSPDMKNNLILLFAEWLRNLQMCK